MAQVTVQTKIKTWETGFTAVFDGISALPNGVGEVTTTAPVQLGDQIWSLKLYPGGIDVGNAGQVSCMLQCDSTESPIRVFYSMSVVQQDGTMLRSPSSQSVQFNFSSENKSHGSKRLFASSEISAASKIINAGKLTIRVELVLLGNVEHSFIGNTEEVPTISNEKYNPSEKNELGVQLYQSLLSGTECYADITLNCHGIKLKAHKFILTARSTVFDRMFSTELKEAATNEVHMDDLMEDTVVAFLCYCYTDNIPGTEMMTTESVQELLIMASMYEVKGLRTICEDYMTTKIHASNAIKLLNLAALYDAPKLKRCVLHFIAANAKSVLEPADCIDHLDKDLCLELMRTLAGIGVLNGSNALTAASTRAAVGTTSTSKPLTKAKTLSSMSMKPRNRLS